MRNDWDRQLSDKRVLVELTDVCNLNCPMCCNRKSPHGVPQGFMDFRLFCRILAEIDLSKGWSVELFWLGESLLHPEIEQILLFAREKLQGTPSHINLHTNAILLNKRMQELILSFGEKFPWITFSLDAAGQATYSRVRGGQLSQANDNIKSFILMRKYLGMQHPHINLQFIVMPENASEALIFAEQWQGFYKAHEIISEDNIYFKRLEVHNIDKQHEANALFESTIKQYGLYSQRTESINIVSTEPSQRVYWFEEPESRRVCAAPFKNPVIRWDGEMTVCCLDDIFFYSIGNLNSAPFGELWYGERMNQFRWRHIQGRYDELLTRDGWPKCKHCIGYYFPRISSEEIAVFTGQIKGS